MNTRSILSKIAGPLVRPTLVVGLFAAAALLGGVPSASSATAVSGTISQDTTWTADGGPYVVNGLTVENGATLTVEAGTVVKIGYRSGMTVRGAMDVNGAPGARVTITSVRDDSAGGDTNGDGEATAPSRSDWKTIGVEGLGILHLTDADVRYGGYFYYNDRAASVYLGGGTVNMDGATVSMGVNAAVRQVGGVLDASGSELSGSSRGLLLENGSASASGTLFHGSSVGLSASSGSLSLTGCSFEGNGAAVSVDGSVSLTNWGNSASGNGVNGFVMSNALAADARWDADLPYVLSNLSVPAGVTLTLGPGAVVKGPGMTVSGRLVASGTEEARVTFTSLKDDSAGGDTNGDGAATSPARGDWGTIRLPAGASAEIRHADVRYGGRHYNSWDPRSALLVEGGSLILDRSSVSLSSNDGVQVTAGAAVVSGSALSSNYYSGLALLSGSAGVASSSLASNGTGVSASSGSLSLTGCSFAGNGAAVSVDGSVALTNWGNSASGNGSNGISVGGTLTADALWVADLSYVSRGPLTVAPGVTLAVGSGAVVKVQGEVIVRGSLVADGMPGARVTFTSLKDDSAGGDTNGDGAATSPARGDWDWVRFLPGSSGDLRYADFRWGGGHWGDPGSQVSVEGGVVSLLGSSLSLGRSVGASVSSGSLTAEETSFSSQQYGLQVAGGSASAAGSSFSGNSSAGAYAYGGALTLGGCVFSGNGAAVYARGAAAYSGSGNSASGNALNGVLLGGDVTADRHLAADLPYVVNQWFRVLPGVTLTVDPGAVVKLSSEFGVAGSLVADGTPGARVTFTSLKDDSAGGDTNGDGAATSPAKGDWAAVRVEAGGTAVLRDADLRWGGNYYNSASDAACLRVSGGSVSLSGSTLSRCQVYGVRVTSGSLTAEGSSFSSGQYGLMVEGGSASASGSSFSGNSGYGVYGSAAAAVDARGSWWGDASGPRHASNPAGAGDRVSDNVLFDPWLDCDPTVPGACAPPGPTLSNLSQRDGGGIEVVEGGTVKGADLTLSADLASPSGAPVRLEVEMRPLAEPFTGEATGMTEYQSYEGTFSVPAKAYMDVDYHWRARAAYEDGTASDWVDFGADPSAADFTQFTRTLRVGVVMAELQGVPHDSSEIDKQPCKLLPDRVYYDGHGTDYYEDIAYCLDDYYRENSYGKVAIETAVHNPGQWLSLGGGLDDYLGSEETMFDELPAGVRDDYDVVFLVYSGDAANYQGQRLLGDLALIPPQTSAQRVLVSEYSQVGSWAHEMGHALGMLLTPQQTAAPDLYKMGRVDKWGVMGMGGWNGGIFDVGRLYGDGTDPSSMTAYTRRFFGWLGETSLAKTAYGPQWVEALSTQEYGGRVIRYNLGPADSGKYYLLEARNRGGAFGDWESSLPGLDGINVLAVYVDERGKDEYGYEVVDGGLIMRNQGRTVDIPGNTAGDVTGSVFNNAVIGFGETYRDLDNLVKFTAQDYRNDADGFAVRTDIQPIEAGSFEDMYWGAVMKAETKTYGARHLYGSVQSGHVAVGQLGASLRPPWYGYLMGLAVRGKILTILATLISLPMYLWYAFRPREKRDASKRKLWMFVLIVSVVLLCASQVIMTLSDKYGWHIIRETVGPHLYASIPLGGGPEGSLGMPLKPRWYANLKGFALDSRLLTIPALLVSLPMFLWHAFRSREKRDARKRKWWLIVLATSVFLLFASQVIVTLSDKYKRHITEEPVGKHLYSPEFDETQFDLDLHVWCSDGRHVGVDYATGEYEVGVEGAITNGDSVGAPEWIFFPPTPGNASCRHSVSARDNEEFLVANPDLAAQIPDPSDSYDIYARTIDPATGILTSATLDAQPILPGETVAHALSVDETTGQPTVAPGVVDIAPPVTVASLSGAAGNGGWFTSAVAVALAADDADGSGVASTGYSTDGGLNWQSYSTPFTIEGDGVHAVMFGSRDGAGNSEATKTLEVRIDAAAPEVSITAPADGLLTNQPTASVSGPAADAGSGLASVSVNGIECEVSGPAWSCPAVPLSEGANTLNATAADAAGNAATASVTVTYAPDSDADGVPDRDDACPASAGSPDWQGCPSAALVTFRRHTVGSGPRPGSTKEPVAGAEVRAFSLAAGSCADSVGVSPHDYGLVHSTCATPFSAVTGPDGTAAVGLLPGSYLLVAQDPQTQVFAGVHSGGVAAGEAPDKFLQVIVRADGSSVPAKTTKRTGSLLYIVEPEWVEWDSATELYPFVLDAPDGEWGVTVSVQPPEGFTADYPALSETVADGYKAVQFTLTDEGSCWECGTGFSIQIDHKGRREVIRRNVPTPMTEAFAKSKGLTKADVARRGITVMPGRGKGR
jgi:hypothetical protein